MKPGNLSESFYEEARQRLQRRIGRELSAASSVLDLGCGSCGLGQFLRDTYGQRVTGVDISDGAFPEHYGTSDGQTMLKCIKADAAHLDFVGDDSVDAVVSVWALHEMEDAEGALREARRVLRAGGRILIVDFPRGSLAQRLWSEEYYTTSEIDRMLTRAGFAEIKVKQVEHGQIIWGSGHA